jgi:hypothetical protein
VASPDAAGRVAAENWFLDRGLPAVLTRRARWRRLWARSAPVLAGYGALTVIIALLHSVSGDAVIYIDDNPDPAEWVIIALLLLTIPVTLAIAIAVSRIGPPSGRRTAASVSVAAAVICGVIENGTLAERGQNVVTVGLVVAGVVALAGLGIGSVLGWAVRLTGSHLASTGVLFARALPVVLLTVLVFFNGYVWSMATKISRERMWLVIGFLVLVACTFLLTGIVERVRPMLAVRSVRAEDDGRLIDTPFAAMPDPVIGEPLTRAERINVVFVVVASQIAQIAMVAVVTSGIFFTLGLLALSPDLLIDWTRGGSAHGTAFGMTLPVPQALIHVTMFLGALTFMFVSARAVGNGEYRSEILDPLIDDLRFTLVARNRYRAHISR